MTAPPNLGYVRITTTDPPLSIQPRLSDAQPIVTGYGGWNQTARPRRSPITVWAGLPGLTMTLPILFNSFRSTKSVEGHIADLEKMASPTGSDGQPPRVTVDAVGGHVPHQGRQWVISDLAYGPAEMNGDGNRTRQQVTLTLLEYVAVDYVAQRSAAKRQQQKAKAKRTKAGAAKKRVHAKRSSKAAKKLGRELTGDVADGEDLLTIAARELGDADRWVEIAALNGIRDPRTITTGQVIRLP